MTLSNRWGSLVLTTGNKSGKGGIYVARVLSKISFDRYRVDFRMSKTGSGFLMKLSRYVRVFLGLFFALNSTFSLAPFSPELSGVCADERTPTAEDIYEMMKKLTDPGLTGIDKKRLTAVIFVHQDVYRRAVINGKFPADDAYVQAFLEAKKEMQVYVARRMNAIHYMKTGKNLKAPIIPFGYKNIRSDDDIITGLSLLLKTTRNRSTATAL